MAVYARERVETLMKPLLWLAAAALLTSCGGTTVKPRSGSTSYSSTLPPTGTGAVGSANLQCSPFSSPDVRLAGRVMIYVNGGALQEDRVRVRISTISSSFAGSSTASIRMYRWRAGSSGSPELDSTPLTFTIERSDINYPISGVMNTLTGTDLSYFQQSSGLTGSPQDFFNRVTLVPIGVDYNWSALKIVVADGTGSVSESDMLLPAFAANPNKYAQFHPMVLSQLHPFWNQQTQNLSDADWESRGRTYCF